MQPFSRDNIPPYHRPVLIQLKRKSAPPFESSSGFRAGTDNSLLEGGVFYGFFTAVLAFSVDGFGEKHPSEFRALRPQKAGECVGLGETVRLVDVESWMVLP
jgi:hypothetical protein